MIYSSRGANLNYRLVNPEPVNDLPVPSSRLQIFRRDSDNKALELERIARESLIK